MNRDKQIEEMMNDIADVWIVDLDGVVHTLSERLWNDDIYNIANELYNAGYRKAEDVAREIFEEIKNEMRSEIAECQELLAKSKDDYYDGKIDAFRFAIIRLGEITKKYTESEKDK